MVNFTELNKEIVLHRGDVKRARLLLIQALCRHIRKLRDKKGQPAQVARNQQRAERLHEEITVLKGLKADDVTKAGLFAAIDVHKVLSDPSSSSKERAMARLISHKALKGKLDIVRAKFNIIPDQKTVSGIEMTTKGKQLVKQDKKKADKPRQTDMEKKSMSTERTETASTTSVSSQHSLENTKDTSEAEQSSNHEEGSVGSGEEDEMCKNKDVANKSEKPPDNAQIVMSSINEKSDSEENEEDNEEEVEDCGDNKMGEIPTSSVAASLQSKTESQVPYKKGQQSDDQTAKSTGHTTTKRKGPRRAACDAEDEDEDMTVTGGDDMFLREGEPDPEEDTIVKDEERTLDSGRGSEGQAMARGLPGESMFVGSLAGEGRSRSVKKKGKFEKRTGKRPMERGSTHKFPARGRHPTHSRVSGAGKVAKPSSSELSGHLHPSWIAKRKQKEQAGQITAFQGKKIVFSD